MPKQKNKTRILITSPNSYWGISPPPQKKKKHRAMMGNGIHQAAEDLERIEPVLSLEGRLESSPRQGKKPWVVGEETHDALRHTGMNKRKQCYDSACSFFSPKNKRNKQKEG